MYKKIIYAYNTKKPTANFHGKLLWKLLTANSHGKFSRQILTANSGICNAEDWIILRVGSFTGIGKRKQVTKQKFTMLKKQI